MEPARFAQDCGTGRRRHPQWNGAADWPEEVVCVYYEGALETSLRSLVDWPIEHVLVSHGDPVIGDGGRRIDARFERSRRGSG